MKKILRTIVIFSCFTLTMLTTNCGFHFRGTQTLPPELHTLYLDIDKPDAPFSQAVRALLLSLHIHLVSSANKASYILQMSYEFTHSIPNITSSNQTVSYNFKLRVTACILDNQGKIVVPKKKIGVAHSLLVNSNQIYMPNTATFVEEEIGRDAINLLYFWLTNKETHQALKTNKVVANAIPPSPSATPPVENLTTVPEPSEPPSSQATQENLPD